MTKIWLWLAFLLLSSALLIVWQWPDGRMRLITCDVGQGDALLITQGFRQVLVDGGNSDTMVLECLARHLPYWDRKLDLVIATHPDADHIGGLLAVMDRYQVLVFVAPGISSQSELFINLYQKVTLSNAKVITATKGQRISVGMMLFDILWPGKNNESIWQNDYSLMDQSSSTQLQELVEFNQVDEPNRHSVVARLAVQGIEVLLTGDITAVEELALLSQPLIAQVDILKVPHHGSKTSSSETFLEKVKADVALLSLGQENRYGHPDPEVVSRLEKSGSLVFRTDQMGDIVLILEQGRVIKESRGSFFSN